MKIIYTLNPTFFIKPIFPDLPDFPEFWNPEEDGSE